VSERICGHAHDITLPLRPSTPTWPGDPQFSVQPALLINENGARVSHLTLGSHSGTHVDAPAHLLANGKGVDELDLDALLGPTVVVYLPDTTAITREDLASSISKYHHNLTMPCPRRLLLKTRNSDRGLLSGGFTPDYVALTAPAAEWLVAIGVILVGIDALSVDPFDDASCSVHHILLENGIIIVEGLDLGQVSPGAYSLVCLPLRISGGDGAPARALLVH
jgi:arylformamidase